MKLKSITLPGLTGEYSIPQTAEDVGAISTTLLWENASPASGFDAQTISLDLSEYQFVLIYFDTHATTGTFKGYYSSTIAKVGKPGLQCNNGEAGTYIITRAFAVTTNGIEFTLAFYAKTYAGELKNTPNCLVPYQIYGIKGVS